MESLLVLLGGLAALLVFGLVWLGGADLVVAAILKYTIEPLVRWYMRVFLGVDRPVVGPEALIGVKGRALSEFGPAEAGFFEGRVEVGSESWNARSPAPIPAGSTISVVSSQGLRLNVERVN
jgi:membrane protein implicated in regulation of membrane protease activity